MPISQITSIEPTQQGGYESAQNGYIYTFIVGFSDGVSGEAGAKNSPPPYAVGDTMEYTITRSDRYRNKIKVQMPKNGQQGGGGQPQRYSPPPARPSAPNQAGGGSINGQTIGMAINQACEFARAGGKGFDKAFIYETASSIIRLSQKLESGQLAPLPGQPSPAPQPAPPPPQPQKPRPGPEGSAFQYGQSGGSAAPGDIDEDVPFAPITI